MTARFELYVAAASGERIPVEVERKRVRNLNLRVRGNGTVHLSIPVRTSVATAQAFLNRKAGWIAERVQRRAHEAGETESAGVIPLEGPSAGMIPLWGALVNAAEVLGAESVDSMPQEELARRIDALYRREIADALPAVAQKLEATMNAHASRWSLRTMKTRWGSCTPRTGAIRINVRLAAYPPACLEFVIAHELTHLMEPSHNARFHALLDLYCPRNRELSALLKRPAREIAQP